MAHTDVHLPWHVKEKDPYWTLHAYTNYSCGCKMCTGQDQRKRNRRRERAAQRAVLKQARKLIPHHLQDIDVHIPAASDWHPVRATTT